MMATEDTASNKRETESVDNSALLANVSHEVRTPLNAILGYTSMLLDDVWGELNEKQRKSVRRISSNAQHLLGLLSDILDLTKLDAGKMPVHVDTFELSDLVREILEELEPLIEKAQLKAVGDFPQAPLWMESDRQKVKQIVVNLLTNALKFTPDGEIRIRISTRDESGLSEMAVIEVCDTGMGIAPRDQEKIFESFRQVDSSVRRARGGAGLGLAICRQFATMLNGSVSVLSEVGEGATFIVKLPMRIKARKETP